MTKGRQGGAGKSLVLGMRERGGEVRAMAVANTRATTIEEVLHDNVARRSVICTDAASHYGDIGDYERLSVNHSAREFVNGMAHTNGVESVWALLKRGYNGVYHNWSAKHLERYIGEFTFRLNEGSCRVDTMQRIGALLRECAGRRLTYRELTRD